MKTILVPTDFSDHALYALKTAADIARKIKAEIILIHVSILPSSEYGDNLYYSEFYDQIVSSVNNKLDNLMEANFLKGLKVSRQVISNMLLHEVVTDEIDVFISMPRTSYAEIITACDYLIANVDHVGSIHPQ